MDSIFIKEVRKTQSDIDTIYNIIQKDANIGLTDDILNIITNGVWLNVKYNYDDKKKILNYYGVEYFVREAYLGGVFEYFNTGYGWVVFWKANKELV